MTDDLYEDEAELDRRIIAQRGGVAYRPFNASPTDGDESVRLILDAATSILDGPDDPRCEGVTIALAAILSADERPASEILAEAFARPEIEWNT